MANDRHRRTGTRWLVLLVSLIAATACTGAVGNGSSVSIPASPPVAPRMHNGPIDVYGGFDGVRALAANGTGAHPYRCPRPCSNEIAADWSSDGTHLAITALDGLYVVDVAGGRDRLFVPDQRIGDVAWSPDGSRIAYVDDGFRIDVIDPDGSRQAAIAGGSDIADLSWSPDGSRIAYSADGPRSRREVRVMGVAPGAGQRFVGWGEHPVWSPDGSSIAYFSVGGCAIREVSPAGRAAVTLFDRTSVAARCDDGIDLTWSPDGTELAALVSRDITSRKGVAAVYLVKADGSRARPYTDWLASGWDVWRGITWQPVP